VTPISISLKSRSSSWGCAQVAHVVGDAVDLEQRDAPLDAPVQGARLVEREVVAAAVAQQHDDAVEGALNTGLGLDVVARVGGRMRT
jgi:hypothetical protein